MTRVLLVDDEDRFRTSLARRLRARGLDTIDLPSGEEALKVVRNDHLIDVVVLDRKMPGMQGEEALREIKQLRPEVQVIMLTGHGSIGSATEAGRLDAHSYLQKPCEIEALLAAIGQAREQATHARQRFEIPHVEKGSLKAWLLGSHNSRPGLLMLGAFALLAILLAPPSSRLMELVSSSKTGQASDPMVGYSGYTKMTEGESIAAYYGRYAGLEKTSATADGCKVKQPLSPSAAAFRAHAMLGILVTAALFWATGAMPVGVTAMLVGLLMYLLGVLTPDDVARAYAKDAVVFIFGVLAMSKAIAKTGLDPRIGLLLMGPATSLTRYLFLFLPLLAVACSFVSEDALVAFIMPLILVVYSSSVRAAGVKRDKALATMFRNAVMMGILTDYGIAPTFGQWVVYGLPFVPVMALVIAAYLSSGSRVALRGVLAAGRAVVLARVDVPGELLVRVRSARRSTALARLSAARTGR